MGNFSSIPPAGSANTTRIVFPCLLYMVEQIKLQWVFSTIYAQFVRHGHCYHGVETRHWVPRWEHFTLK